MIHDDAPNRNGKTSSDGICDTTPGVTLDFLLSKHIASQLQWRVALPESLSLLQDRAGLCGGGGGCVGGCSRPTAFWLLITVVWPFQGVEGDGWSDEKSKKRQWEKKNPGLLVDVQVLPKPPTSFISCSHPACGLAD